MRVPSEGAHICFADHLTRRTLIGKPRPTSADGGRDRRDQQRLGAARLACMPQVDDARCGGIRALLSGCELSLRNSAKDMRRRYCPSLPRPCLRVALGRSAGKPPG
jgi:hypothetical protein